MATNGKAQGQRSQSVPALLLLLVFAVFAVMTVLFGARVYSNVLERGDESFELRASLSYVTGKLRAYDCVPAPEIAHFGDMPVLKLYERGDDYECVTYIYFTNGSLYELYADASMDFDAGAGVAIAELSDFTFEFDGEYLRLRATAKSSVVREAVAGVMCDAEGGAQ